MLLSMGLGEIEVLAVNSFYSFVDLGSLLLFSKSAPLQARARAAVVSCAQAGGTR